MNYLSQFLPQLANMQNPYMMQGMPLAPSDVVPQIAALAMMPRSSNYATPVPAPANPQPQADSGSNSLLNTMLKAAIAKNQGTAATQAQTVAATPATPATPTAPLSDLSIRLGQQAASMPTVAQSNPLMDFLRQLHGTLFGGGSMFGGTGGGPGAGG